MADTEFEGDLDEVSANSEVRIIALELMRIAQQRKKPFIEVAKEYIANVYTLKSMLEGSKE